METVIKASAVAIVSALCILLVRKSNREIGLAVAIACAAVICFAAVGLLSSIVELMRFAADKAGVGSVFLLPIIKCAGIAMVVRITSGLCKDAEQSAIASAVELLGSAAALFTALPVMSALLETIGELI